MTWLTGGLIGFLLLIIGAQAQQSNEQNKKLHDQAEHLELTDKTMRQYKQAFEALAIHHKTIIEAAATDSALARRLALLWLKGKESGEDEQPGGDRVLSA